MKTYTITEQQIEQAHKAACSGWKTRIEGWFPEKFKRKSGWYKDSKEKNKWLCFRDYENEKMFGFDCDGNWIEYKSVDRDIEDTEYPAPEKEVEERLIEEAKRRGFKEGTKHNHFDKGRELYDCKGVIKMDYNVGINPDNKNTLYFTRGQGLIFKDGEWADVVSKADESKEYITVDGIKYKRCN